MAERISEDDKILAALSTGVESGLNFGFGNTGAEDNNPNNVPKKRGFEDDSGINAGDADRDPDNAKVQLAEEGEAVLTRRPRGRPLGSKNKRKGPLIGICEISDTLKSHVLEVPNGFDVTNMVATFVRSRNEGVFVMSGSGNVTSVTLKQPAVAGGVQEYTRLFEIISLTGTFRPGADRRGFTGLQVRLTDAEGNFVGGTVMGRMIAYGSVQVVVGTAMNIDYEQLNGQAMQLPSSFLFPTTMPLQQHFQSPNTMISLHQRGMMPRSNFGQNLAIGSLGQNPSDIDSMPMNNIGPMNNVGPNLAIGSLGFNPRDISRVDIMPMNSVRPNMAIGASGHGHQRTSVKYPSYVASWPLPMSNYNGVPPELPDTQYKDNTAANTHNDEYE